MWEAASSFADQMAALGGYMAERVTDIHDVRARIVAELTGQQAPGIPVSTEPFILAAIDLAPADTATPGPQAGDVDYLRRRPPGTHRYSGARSWSALSLQLRV